MSKEYWDAERREYARRELIRRADAEQKALAEWCVAWFAMNVRIEKEALK